MRARTYRLRGALAALTLAAAPALSADEQPAECGPGPEPLADVLFHLGGQAYGDADLSPALQQALYEARSQFHDTLAEIAEVAVIEVELARRAEATGQTSQALARELFAIEPPADAVIEHFYRENQARIGRPLEAVRGEIREMIVASTVRARQAELAAEIKRDGGFELALVPPAAPYAEIDIAGYPSRGADDAAVTVVEFADYQCPHCRRTAAVLEKLIARYPDRIKVVHMDFPVNRSGVSRLVAEGAACADQLGAFWKFHDLAFARQSGLSASSPAALAAEAGLDATAFEACMASALPRERVARAEAEGRRLGVRATPTVFLDGRRLRLHDVERELPRAVEEALGAKRDG